MFTLALAFLILIAVRLHVFEQEPATPQPNLWLTELLSALWFPMLLESAIGYWRHRDYSWRAGGRLLLLWLIPPYRMVLSTHPGGSCVWLPLLGWRQPDDELFRRLECAFSIPMLFIALLILPILAIELFLADALPLHPELQWFLNVGTSLIWFAFTLEFVLMSAVAESKKKYLLANWLTLIIILLPLLAFLRSFQAARLLRLGKTAKALKAYQLRGLGLRAWRGVVALELIERILHRNPYKRLAHLNALLQDKERELEHLRDKVRRLNRLIAERERIRAGEEDSGR